MHTVGQLLTLILWVFLLLLIARLVMQYVLMFARSYEPHGVAAMIWEVVYSVTDPPLNFFRSFIPPLRLGGVELDLSFLVLFVLVNIGLIVAGRL